MPITSKKNVEAWFEEQDHQTQIWFAARCGLRAVPGLGLEPDATKGDLLVASFCAMLIAVAGATCSAIDMKVIRHAARSADFAAAADRSAASVAAADRSVNAARHSAAPAYAEASRTAFAARSAACAADAAFSASASVASAKRSAGVASFSAAASVASLARSAAARYYSAPYYSAAYYSACDRDSGAVGIWSPLWHDARMPEGLAEAWENLDAFLAADPETWAFWREWYKRILCGDPLPWDLSFRIATELNQEDWEKGPAHVAQLIEPIWREFKDAPLDKDALKAHVSKLVSQPYVIADAAESTANLIGQTVARFKNEEPKTNHLPDGFETFEEALPQSYLRMSVILRGSYEDRDKQISDLQNEVNRLNQLVQELRGNLTEARQKLADARLSSLEAQQVRTFGERLQTTLTNVTLLGAIGMSGLTFFGISAEDLRYDPLKQQLQGLAADMAEKQPEIEDGAVTTSLRPDDLR